MTDTIAEPLPATAQARETKIPVAVLGATGSVGQRFVELLADHPWFRLHEVVASERSAGRSYGDAADWRQESVMPPEASALQVKSLGSELESKLIFSGLDSSVAGEAEDLYADRGCAVVTNSRNHRMGSDVPLLIPEINADHLEVIEKQRARRGSRGFIVTNPNCSTVGLAMAIAPIERQHGIASLHVTTLQAISGAGYNGVSSYSILDNAIPFIGNEEEKIESEPLKILGRFDGEKFEHLEMTISAQTNRVPVIDGHMLCMSIGLRSSGSLRSSFRIERIIADIKEAIRSFRGEPQRLALPSAPQWPLHLLEEDDRPQPRLDRMREKGMSVSVGRIRPCPILDVRMVALVHNTIRGAAGAAILNAELLDAEGFLDL